MNTTGISGSVSSSSLIKSDSSSNTGNVKRLTIKNNLFLDVGSLSKNLQTILNSCQMIVIAKVKSVTKHQAEGDNEESNPFGLEDNETYFLC